MKFQEEGSRTDVQQLNDDQLISTFGSLVKTERKITYQVLIHIIEIERRRLYNLLGFDSMYAYLIRVHGYSGGSAQRRIQSAQLLKDLPGMKESLEDGRINLTQLNQVQLMVKQKERLAQHKISLESKKEIIAAIENKTSFETELFLSQALDLPVKIADVARPQQDESLRLEVTLSKEVQNKIAEVKSLLSHVKHNPSWENILEMMADFVLSKKSPDRNVRAKTKKSGAENLTRADAAVVRSRHIPASIRREVLKNTFGCQYRSSIDGRCCGSKFQLQVDHILPFAFGGDHSPENLRVLCRSQNLAEARRLGLHPLH